MKTKDLILAGAAAICLLGCANNTEEKEPIDQVNVFNGTAFSGNTYPGATLPFGLVQLSPDTRADHCSGYHYDDETVLGFSHTQLSGTGCPDLGDFLFTPARGKAVAPLSLSHAREQARPGYYKVDFPEEGITVELTVTPHVGVHRYTFKGDGPRLLLVDADYCNGDWCTAETKELTPLGNNEIEGHRLVNGWATKRDIYMSGIFSVPFVKAEPTEEGRLLLTFADDVSEITAAVGLSGVSMAGAKANREAEVPDTDFDTVLAQATDTWAATLGSIQVEGGPTALFYTNLYHVFLTPNAIDDQDGSYRDELARNRLLPAGHHFYSTLSIWDIFRSWAPLISILRPDVTSDIVNSMLDMYDCRGDLPMWPLASSETDCMIGYHSVSVIADAWLRGIRTFDGEKALQAMIVTSNQHNVNASELYNQYGYIPADLKAESVSQTLEFAYDDWCIARMAESLGHDDIRDEYDRRALRYQNIFDSSTGFMRGKNADGNWSTYFNPIEASRDYTEATPWQYRFFMPHDTEGMKHIMGGNVQMLAALDSLFFYQEKGQKSPDAGIGGMIGQYAHGNEPSHHMAYLYYWVGQPWRSQQLVRKILTELYSTAPDGICGNEDCGQMSAWYVLSSLGLYPACPGTGEYLLVAPSFKTARISLPNGKTLTIKADNPKNCYIADVTLNGKTLQQLFITYDQIMEGGELDFTLSAKPNHNRDALPAPYSLTTRPIVSTPVIAGNLSYFTEPQTVVIGCRTPEVTIHYTTDGSEPTTDSPVYKEPFTVGESCVLQARAYRDGFQPSPLAVITARRLVYHQPLDASTAVSPGCRFTYHEGAFRLVSEVEKSKPVAQGVMAEPDIAKARAEEHFGYVFTGCLDIPADGMWSFALTSDDGSVLYVDDELIVNNDGSHSAITATGSAPLLKGLHPFRLIFFEDYEGQSLTWAWRAEDEAEFSPIPTSRICYRK